MHPLRVGICIIEVTRLKLQIAQLLNELCVDGNVKIIVIDLEKDLEEQGPFDVIIHKILEWYNDGEVVGGAKLLKLSDYVLRSNPPIKMIDPIEETVRLADRLYTMNVMKACEFSMHGIKVFVPPYTYLNKDCSNETSLKTLKESGVGFPIVSKPPITRCDFEAHDFSLIFTPDKIADITGMLPCVVQQFVNHNSMLYKVAAVGETYYICERPSVKNLDDNPDNADTVYFNSLSVSKRDRYNPDLHDRNPIGMKFRTSGKAEDERLESDRNLLDEKVVKELLRRLYRQIDVSLIGIDIIVEEGTGNYGLIDLNYLPSFDGVRRQMAKNIYDKLTKHKRKMEESSDEDTSSQSE